jgi:uncharacterized protein
MAGMRIRLRVAPGARRTEPAGRFGDGWRVRLAAPPTEGRANAELVAFLAAAFGVPRAAVRVTAGHAARDKLVEIDGVEPAQVERVLGG